MIRVLIVDDMIILRECLKMAIDQDQELEVVGGAGDGKMAVKMAHELRPDVILMDLNMPVYSGHEAIIDIKKMYPEIKILVLSVKDDEKNITLAFRNGADGYVLKDIMPKDLFAAIKSAFQGKPYVHDYAFYIGKEYDKPKSHLPDSDLSYKVGFTEREKEVIELVVKGMTNTEIADILGLSVGRARNIVADLISKYMVKNRTQLAVMIIRTHSFETVE